MIVELIFEETAEVEMVNVADVAAAGIVTDAGTVAGPVAESVTMEPVEGAPLDRVTVPVEELPPTTDVGDTVTEVMVGRPFTVSGTEIVVLP